MLAKCPEILGVKDDFECSNCDAIHDLCAVCAEIEHAYMVMILQCLFYWKY